MVLKNPYVFLIKHFKAVHLFITAIFAYIVIKNNQIYSFLREVIKDSVNRYNALNYIDNKIFLWITIGLILCITIFYLFKQKDKPRRIYLLTTIGYIIISVYMIVLFTYMNGIVSTVVDQKTIRLYADITLITLVFQYIIIGMMLIRGLGFDIKKFNFSKDIGELHLDANDYEEIEVNTQIDTTNIMRSARKYGRELSYFYKEFKIYILIILAVLLIFLGTKFYNYVSTNYKIYKENDVIGITNFITINNSYYVKKDNKQYIIINFGIYKYGRKQQFNIDNLELNINSHKYTPNKNICSKFNKYGICYKKQYITNENNNYIAVYEIEDNVKKNNYLIYNETFDDSYKIKLNLKSA